MMAVIVIIKEQFSLGVGEGGFCIFFFLLPPLFEQLHFQTVLSKQILGFTPGEQILSFTSENRAEEKAVQVGT